LLILVFLAGYIKGYVSAHRWLRQKLTEWGGTNFAQRFYNEQIKRGDQ
jgi:hypothetical protein